jgi:hypothetical protein
MEQAALYTTMQQDWKYCDSFLEVAQNHTFAGNPDPRVDDAADGGPLRGWAQTSGYNAVANLGSAPTDNAALLCYDRQGWGGGKPLVTSQSLLVWLVLCFNFMA